MNGAWSAAPVPDCTADLNAQPVAAQVAACEAALASADAEGALAHRLSLAKLALQQRDYARLDGYLAQVAQAPAFVRDERVRYHYFRLHGLRQWYQKQLDSADQYLQQAQLAAAALGDSALLAKSLNELGVIQNARGRYKEALQYLQQSLALKQAQQDEHGSAVTLSNIGLAHMRMEAYADAEAFYLEALQAYGRYVARHPDDSSAVHGLAHLHEDLTLLYSLWQRPEQSAVYAEQLIALYDALLSAEERVRVLTTLATAQMQANQWPAADRLLQNVAAALAQQPTIRQPAALLALARYAQHQADWPRVQQLAEQAVLLAIQQQASPQQAAGLLLLAQSAQALHRPDAALRHYREYMQLREAQLAGRYDQEVGALRQTLVREQLQRRLAENAALSERQSVAIQRLTIIGLLAVLLLLLTVFIALAYGYRKRQQQRELLRQIAHHRQQLLLLQHAPVEAAALAEEDSVDDMSVDPPAATQAAPAENRLSPPENRLAAADTRDMPGDETIFKRLLVETMLACVALWEKTTQSNRVELADRSKIWTISIDDGRLRTRSLDKYLSLDKLPRQPRWRSVVQTCHYILAECPLCSEDRARLNGLLDAIMATIKTRALASAPE